MRWTKAWALVAVTFSAAWAACTQDYGDFKFGAGGAASTTGA